MTKLAKMILDMVSSQWSKIRKYRRSFAHHNAKSTAMRKTKDVEDDEEL